MNAHGIVHKYGDHVDTDVIIPARYLNTQSHKELASHCMEDIDKDFIHRVKDGNIIVAGVNFGCGSPRDHLPPAVKRARARRHQSERHLLRHRGEFRPHLLPQRHQHRPRHFGVPRRERGH